MPPLFICGANGCWTKTAIASIQREGLENQHLAYYTINKHNLHYADESQELGWHFDNSSFAITLMIQRPESEGAFEYVNNVRDVATGEINYEYSRKSLEGEVQAKAITVDVLWPPGLTPPPLLPSPTLSDPAHVYVLTPAECPYAPPAIGTRRCARQC